MLHPGFKGGQKAMTKAEFVDIYPTICELAGLPLLDHLQGKSFVSVMKNPDSSHKDFALSKWYNGLTIVKDQFHYTEWRNKDDSLHARMLYDHNTDPHENVNVAGEEKYHEDIASLSEIMKANRGAGYLVE